MLKFALKNLFTRPLRSLLALCGLTVAIMGMVGLFSVAEGIDDLVRTTFGKLPGVVVMQPGAPIPLFSRLPMSWGLELEKLPGVHAIHPEIWARAHVIEGQPTVSPPRLLFGVDIVRANRLRYSAYREAMKEGRFLGSNDIGSNNTVISRSIAEEFKRKVGDTFTVDGVELTIVGIYEVGSLLLDVAILTDAGLVRKIGRFDATSACSFYVEPEDDSQREKIVADIKTLFRGRSAGSWEPETALAGEMVQSARNPISAVLLILAQGIENWTIASTPVARPKAEATATGRDAKESKDELPVEIRSSKDWAEQFDRLSADLDTFLLIMTGIGITIAVLGIVNTMLMSVTERFIEFGILKANGWSDRNVLTLIAWESGLIGVGGGCLGASLGWVATQVINAQWPTRVHLYASPMLLLFSLAFSTAMGLLGGLYPAIWASRMLPMDAIRRG